jgi:hypothetical protein
MGATIVFACFCSAGIAVCLTYIGFTLMSERKKTSSSNIMEEKESKENYRYYEAYEDEDTLNADLD